jgi:tRNA (guanine-N7-)-methyltransferase
VTDFIPKHQFYGRRKGKPLRRHHIGLMEDLLPPISVDLSDPLAMMGERRWLEIGFGGGEHLVHQAACNPDVSLMGAEAFLNGVAKALAHVEEKAVTNLRIHYGDARVLLEALPAESFERIYLPYPDPWPKERQKKRRFVNETNLNHFRRVLKFDGLFLFASDIPDYVAWTREHITIHKGFIEQGDPSMAYENWIETRYENKALREGRTPAYLTFRKI